MPTDLFLVRHGQSFANVSPVIGGMTGDKGLTDLGRDQAERLAARLVQEEFRADQLYASTLARAQQTAAAVSGAIGLPVVDDEELQELRPGDADGLSFDQWAKRWPGLDRGPISKPYQPMATGGESWATFLVRAGAALTTLVTRHPEERVVAVCHGGVIEASFYLAFGLGASVNPVGFRPRNSSITHWRHDPTDTGRPAWTLITFNDTRHLDPAS